MTHVSSALATERCCGIRPCPPDFPSTALIALTFPSNYFAFLTSLRRLIIVIIIIIIVIIIIIYVQGKQVS